MYFKIKPYAWQHEAIAMADIMPDVALLCDMGVGKTGAAINILRKRCMDKGRLRRTLILGPLSVLYNWPEEIEKHSQIKQKNILVLVGSGATRVNMLNKFIFNKVNSMYDRNAIVITNYEALNTKGVFDLLMLWRSEILICDESHLVKNHDASRSKRTYKLATVAEHRYILTGTAILNSPKDIFMQYKILDKGETFGTNFYVFQRKYFSNVSPPWLNFPKWEPIVSMLPHLTDKIFKKAIRIMKDECLDLPERVEQTVYVPLSVKQKKAYTEMKRDFITFLETQEDAGKSKVVTAQLAITKALRLMQIVTGHVTAEDKTVIDFGDIPRLTITKDLLEQITPNHKVILWCSFRHNYIQLSKLCEQLKVGYVFITGDQNARGKQEAIERFRADDKIRVVIANRRAGGVGINLVEAAYSIIYSRNFSLAEDKQSQDRNYRGGSEIHEKIVKIELCAKNTIDELAIQALRTKEDISKQIIDIARRL